MYFFHENNFSNIYQAIVGLNMIVKSSDTMKVFVFVVHHHHVTQTIYSVLIVCILISVGVCKMLIN